MPGNACQTGESSHFHNPDIKHFQKATEPKRRVDFQPVAKERPRPKQTLTQIIHITFRECRIVECITYIK